jgi:hypothetical protein
MMFNAFRGVVIIPAIFLLFTWLSRRKNHKLPLMLIPAPLVIWLLWLPMKPVAFALQDGQPFSQALSDGVEIAFTNFGTEEGSGIDFQFLDMIGSTMTLVDLHGHWFWGTTIAPLFVSPMPRLLWPEKPRINQYQKDLDVPDRNMAALDMTAGLVGESYANFGWFGVAFIPFLVSLCYSLAYRQVENGTVNTPGSLLYLFCLSTYMQVYRDGLISAVWFPFVHCAPLGWAAVSHWLWRPRPATDAYPDSLDGKHAPEALSSQSAGPVELQPISDR